MKGLVQTLFLGTLVITAYGLPSPARRQAFDPNLLMDQYMNLRTDQGSFGSYHPDDIKEDIDSYFQGEGERAHSNNPWGMRIYNPNEAMPQYMGKQQEPGNLVPNLHSVDEKAELPKPNAPESGQAIGFNPNELNKQLMKTLHNSGYSGMVGAEGAGAMGFDPDTVNKELMMSLHAQGHSSTGNHNSKDTGAMNQNGNTGAMNHNGNRGGYNADAVNAGLYSSISYNPNAVNSATFNMPSYSGAGQGMFGGSTGGTGNGPTAGNAGSSTTGQNGQQVTNAGTKGQSSGGGIKTASQTNHRTLFQNNPGMLGASGAGEKASYNPFSISQSDSGLSGQQTGGSVVPSPRLSQIGVPPGIPAGMSLTQTQADKPTVNGIGGLGA